MNRKNILVVDDELSMRQFLEILLKKEGYNVSVAENGDVALKKIRYVKPSVVLMDYNMPESIDGVELLEKIREVSPETEIVVITAYASTEQAIKAIELGAVDYVSKPFNVKEIKDIVRKAVKKNVTGKTLPVHENSEESVPVSMVVESPGMKKLISEVDKITASDSTVLISGESGVGKEVLAEYIHRRSGREKNSWYAINCGAISENLQESELFGHEKGAFTGAYARKKGYFEAANGGTLFLDEIGELSQQMQVKLLRVIQRKRFTPVGGTKDLQTDVRLIAATNKDLAKEVEQGNFRKDLFYRINVFNVYIEPLRKRKEDIIPLAHEFLKIYGEKNKKNYRFSKTAEEKLLSHNFPGNVRELRNIIERSCVTTDKEIITAEDLHITKHEFDVSDRAPAVSPDSPVSLDKVLEEVESRYVKAALEKSDGKLKDAADMLELSVRSLRYRIQKLGLKENGTGDNTGDL